MAIQRKRRCGKKTKTEKKSDRKNGEEKREKRKEKRQERKITSGVHALQEAQVTDVSIFSFSVDIRFARIEWMPKSDVQTRCPRLLFHSLVTVHSVCTSAG